MFLKSNEVSPLKTPNNTQTNPDENELRIKESQISHIYPHNSDWEIKKEMINEEMNLFCYEDSVDIPIEEISSTINKLKDEFVEDEINEHQCHICKNLYVQNSLLPSGNQQKIFTCMLCKQAFKDQKTLKEHAVSHTETHPFVCNFCLGLFKDETSLIIHCMEHFDTDNYMCNECLDKFQLRNESFRRVPKQKESSKKYSCYVCENNFPTNRLLQIHYKRTHIDQINRKHGSPSASFSNEFGHSSELNQSEMRIQEALDTYPIIELSSDTICVKKEHLCTRNLSVDFSKQNDITHKTDTFINSQINTSEDDGINQESFQVSKQVSNEKCSDQNRLNSMGITGNKNRYDIDLESTSLSYVSQTINNGPTSSKDIKTCTKENNSSQQTRNTLMITRAASKLHNNCLTVNYTSSSYGFESSNSIPKNNGCDSQNINTRNDNNVFQCEDEISKNSKLQMNPVVELIRCDDQLISKSVVKDEIVSPNSVDDILQKKSTENISSIRENSRICYRYNFRHKSRNNLRERYERTCKSKDKISSDSLIWDMIEEENSIDSVTENILPTRQNESRSSKYAESTTLEKRNNCFKCRICRKKFSTFELKNKHVGIHKRRTKRYLFSQKFHSKLKLNKYTVKRVINQGVYRCGLCSRRFSQANDLITHVQFHMKIVNGGESVESVQKNQNVKSEAADNTIRSGTSLKKSQSFEYMKCDSRLGKRMNLDSEIDDQAKQDIKRRKETDINSISSTNENVNEISKRSELCEENNIYRKTFESSDSTPRSILDESNNFNKSEIKVTLKNFRKFLQDETSSDSYYITLFNNQECNVDKSIACDNPTNTRILERNLVDGAVHKSSKELNTKTLDRSTIEFNLNECEKNNLINDSTVTELENSKIKSFDFNSFNAEYETLKIKFKKFDIALRSLIEQNVANSDSTKHSSDVLTTACGTCRKNVKSIESKSQDVQPCTNSSLDNISDSNSSVDKANGSNSYSKDVSYARDENMMNELEQNDTTGECLQSSEISNGSSSKCESINGKKPSTYNDNRSGKVNRMHSCNVCDKRFRTKWYLYQHMKVIHLIEWIFMCIDCEQSFLTYKNWSRHRQSSNSSCTSKCVATGKEVRFVDCISTGSDISNVTNTETTETLHTSSHRDSDDNHRLNSTVELSATELDCDTNHVISDQQQINVSEVVENNLNQKTMDNDINIAQETANVSLNVSNSVLSNANENQANRADTIVEQTPTSTLNDSVKTFSDKYGESSTYATRDRLKRNKLEMDCEFLKEFRYKILYQREEPDVRKIVESMSQNLHFSWDNFSLDKSDSNENVNNNQKEVLHIGKNSKKTCTNNDVGSDASKKNSHDNAGTSMTDLNNKQRVFVTNSNSVVSVGNQYNSFNAISTNIYSKKEITSTTTSVNVSNNTYSISSSQQVTKPHTVVSIEQKESRQTENNTNTKDTHVLENGAVNGTGSTSLDLIEHQNNATGSQLFHDDFEDNQMIFSPTLHQNDGNNTQSTSIMYLESNKIVTDKQQNSDAVSSKNDSSQIANEHLILHPADDAQLTSTGDAQCNLTDFRRVIQSLLSGKSLVSKSNNLEVESTLNESQTAEQSSENESVLKKNTFSKQNYIYGLKYKPTPSSSNELDENNLQRDRVRRFYRAKKVKSLVDNTFLASQRNVSTFPVAKISSDSDGSLSEICKSEPGLESSAVSLINSTFVDLSMTLDELFYVDMNFGKIEDNCTSEQCYSELNESHRKILIEELLEVCEKRYRSRNSRSRTENKNNPTKNTFNPDNEK